MKSSNGEPEKNLGRFLVGTGPCGIAGVAVPAAALGVATGRLRVPEPARRASGRDPHRVPASWSFDGAASTSRRRSPSSTIRKLGKPSETHYNMKTQ